MLLLWDSLPVIGQVLQMHRHGAQRRIWFKRDSGLYLSLCLEAGAKTVGAITDVGSESAAGPLALNDRWERGYAED